MTKTNFLKDPNVKDFIEWLAYPSEGGFPAINAGHTGGKNSFSLLSFPICLNIKESRFVPNGVNVRVNGIEGVLSHYTWKSAGMAKGDWPETKTRLSGLSSALRAAVGRKSNKDALDACRDILKWGGNRNSKVGAYPFLHGMATAETPETLWKYIIDTGASFSLATAVESKLTPTVSLMNAMLTKVHALYALDGLPIYDSRVAAAIASLVEMWRVDTGKSGTSLPPTLAFPATMTSRTVLRLFPHANHPGVMLYGAPGTVAQWSSAKVRLGWILESVLTKLPGLFSTCCATPSLADRMHAFEASLFMIGYDVTCLDCKLGEESPSEYKKALKSLTQPLSSTGTHKTITTLSGRGCPISYFGDVETGFDVKWGELIFRLDPEFLRDIENEFVGRRGVPLGASMTGTIPDDSLGKWIVDEGWTSPRYASAISAILHAEGIITSVGKIGHGIVLDFPEEQ